MWMRSCLDHSVQIFSLSFSLSLSPSDCVCLPARCASAIVCVYWCWLAYTYMQACRSYSILLFVCRVLHFHVVVVLFTQFRYPCFTQYIRCRKHAHALVLSLSTGWLFFHFFPLHVFFSHLCLGFKYTHTTSYMCSVGFFECTVSHLCLALSQCFFVSADWMHWKR